MGTKLRRSIRKLLNLLRNQNITHFRLKWPNMIIGALITLYGGYLRFSQINYELTVASFNSDLLYYYYTPGRNLFENRGFYQNTVDINSPLQGLFFAVMHLITKPFNAVIMQQIQVVISILGMGAAWWWARMLGGKVTALLFLAGLAVYNELVASTASLLTENNYIAFVFISLALFQALLQKSSSVFTAGCAGLMFAASTLQRFNVMLLPIFLVLLMFLSALSDKNFKRRGLSVLVLILTFGTPLSLWALRNYYVYDRPVLTLTRSGSILHYANHSKLDNLTAPFFSDYFYKFEWMDPDIEEFGKVEKYSAMFTGRVVYDKLYKEKFKQYIRLNPLHFLRNYAIRFGNQFILPTQDDLNLRIFGYYPLIFKHLISSSIWLTIPGLLLFLRKHGSNISCWSPVIVYAYFAYSGALFHITHDGRMNVLLRSLGLFWSAFLISAALQLVWRMRYNKGLHGHQEVLSD